MYDPLMINHSKNIYAALTLSTCLATNGIAADFSCKNIHGQNSINQIDEGVLNGTFKPSVKFSVVPSGIWNNAEILDSGSGWVTFSDGYGQFGEDSKNGGAYSPTCEKYDDVCGKFIKFFEYGRKSGDGHKITQFTSKDCCLRGHDLRKGSSLEYFDGELLCYKTAD